MSSHSVTVSFERKNAQPPVFIYGAFTGWQPREMKAVPKTGDEAEGSEQFVFAFDCDVEEGEWPYKFRLANGNWTCDEHAARVVDAQGNENNVLTVKPHLTFSDTGIGQKQPSPEPSSSWEKVMETSNDDAGLPGPTKKLTTELDSCDKIFTEPEEIEKPSPTSTKSVPLCDQQTEAPGPPPVSRHASGDSGPQRRDGRQNLMLSISKPSYGSTDSLTYQSDSSELKRSRSTADIERLSYIMEIPRSSGSNEPHRIMAYQDSRIVQLSPDYNTMIPLASDDHEPTLHQRMKSLLPQRRMSSSDASSLYMRPRASTTSSVQISFPAPETLEWQDDGAADTLEQEVGPSGAPLLRHERVSKASPQSPEKKTSTFAVDLKRAESLDDERVEGSAPPEPTIQDLNDPNIELFPDRREDMLKCLEDLRLDLSPDVSHVKETESETSMVGDHPANPRIKVQAEETGVEDSKYRGTSSDIVQTANYSHFPASNIVADGATEDSSVRFGVELHPVLQEPRIGALRKSYGDLTSNSRYVFAGSKRSLSSASSHYGVAESKHSPKKARWDDEIQATSSSAPKTLDGAVEERAMAQRLVKGYPTAWPKLLWNWMKTWFRSLFGRHKQD